MDNPFVGAIIGRRRAGKTRLLADLLRSGTFKEYKFELIVFVSPTIALQQEFFRLVAPTGILILNELHEPTLKELLKFQDDMEASSVLLILDDIGLSARTKGGTNGCEALNNIAFAGRHYRISIIQLAQRWVQLTPSFRSQLDWFFFAGTANRKELSSIHQEYGEESIQSFKEMVGQVHETPFSWLFFENHHGRMRVQQI